MKDRVVQTAVAMVLLPIIEADSHPNSYAYRPKRNAHQAIEAIKRAAMSGRVEVIDADLSGYFDSISHEQLMRIVAKRISDGTILKLIAGWLRAPVIEPQWDRGKSGGNKEIRQNKRGTPQGGVISPILANAYLNQLDKEVNERCELKPEMVRFADDFVIMSQPGQGEGLLARLKGWLGRKELVLNEKKTRLVNLQQEGIKFLGFSIGMREGKSGRKYPHVEPHPKSLKRFRDGIREKLNRSTLWRDVEDVIPELNKKLKGWSGYFHFGNSTKAMSKMNQYIVNKLQRWLWRKRNCSKALWSTYTTEDLHERYGLFKLPEYAAWKR